MPEKEMTAPYSFAATNDERSHKSTADSVHEPKTIYKNNFEALELLRRYNSAKESAKSAEQISIIVLATVIRWTWIQEWRSLPKYLRTVIRGGVTLCLFVLRINLPKEDVIRDAQTGK